MAILPSNPSRYRLLTDDQDIDQRLSLETDPNLDPLLAPVPDVQLRPPTPSSSESDDTVPEALPATPTPPAAPPAPAAPSRFSKLLGDVGDLGGSIGNALIDDSMGQSGMQKVQQALYAKTTGSALPQEFFGGKTDLLKQLKAKKLMEGDEGQASRRDIVAQHAKNLNVPLTQEQLDAYSKDQKSLSPGLAAITAQARVSSSNKHFDENLAHRQKQDAIRNSQATNRLSQNALNSGIKLNQQGVGLVERATKQMETSKLASLTSDFETLRQEFPDMAGWSIGGDKNASAYVSAAELAAMRREGIIAEGMRNVNINGDSAIPQRTQERVASIVRVANSILQGQSGLAVTDQEKERLRQALNDTFLGNPDALMHQLNQFRKRTYDQTTNTWGMAFSQAPRLVAGAERFGAITPRHQAFTGLNEGLIERTKELKGDLDVREEELRVLIGADQRPTEPTSNQTMPTPSMPSNAPPSKPLTEEEVATRMGQGTGALVQKAKAAGGAAVQGYQGGGGQAKPSGDKNVELFKKHGPNKSFQRMKGGKLATYHFDVNGVPHEGPAPGE